MNREQVIEIIKKHNQKHYEEYPDDTLVFIGLPEEHWGMVADEIVALKMKCGFCGKECHAIYICDCTEG